KTTFETWLVCMGGNSKKSIDNNLVNFSKQKKLEAYGGINAILAWSDNKDNQILIDLPNLDGKAYVYVLCECSINLDLERFKNSKARPEKFVLYTTKKFLLLGNEKETENKLIDLYRTKILQSLGNNEVFWTKADGDKFILLKNTYFFEEKNHLIANILSKYSIPTVKMDKNKLSYLSEKIKGKKSIKYQFIKFSEILRKNSNILSDIEQDQNDFANIIKLLEFILQNKDDDLYLNLKELQLVPLKNHSCSTFGECDYFIANKKCQELFPISGPSYFVYNSDELIKIFNTDIFDVQTDYYNVFISLGVEKIKAYDFVKKYYSHKYLNVNYNKFSKDKQKQLYKIDFISYKNSKKYLPSPYNKTSITTLGYESFNLLYFTKYQDICWTQTKFIYSVDVELLFNLCSDLKIVINYWIKLSTKVFPHKTSDKDKIREFKLKDIKLFLNSDNPFDL
ncbi:33422_t:CDS:2, partial [Gigaspora margarita]